MPSTTATQPNVVGIPIKGHRELQLDYWKLRRELGT